jgi:hypothetical protein
MNKVEFVKSLSKLLGVSKKEIKIATESQESYQGEYSFMYNIRIGLIPNLYLGSFAIICMPGNCGLATLTGFRVHRNFTHNKTINKKQRVSHLLYEFAMHEIVKNHYRSAICTTVINAGTKKAIIPFLEEKGWVKVSQFKNAKTNNEIGVYIRNLHDITTLEIQKHTEEIYFHEEGIDEEELELFVKIYFFSMFLYFKSCNIM